MKNYTLAFWTIKYNYLTNQELEVPPSHCLVSQSIIDENETEVGLMVIDYYTPRNKPHGWWAAVRGPGFQQGVHPIHLVFIKDGLSTPSMAQVIAAEVSVKNLLRLCPHVLA